MIYQKLKKIVKEVKINEFEGIKEKESHSQS